MPELVEALVGVEPLTDAAATKPVPTAPATPVSQMNVGTPTISNPE